MSDPDGHIKHVVVALKHPRQAGERIGVLDDLDEPVLIGDVPQQAHPDAAGRLVERDRLGQERQQVATTARRDTSTQVQLDHADTVPQPFRHLGYRRIRLISLSIWASEGMAGL